MDLEFRCPSCDKLLQAPARLAGKKVRCTKCGEVVAAPSDDDASEPRSSKHAVTTRPAASKPPRASADDDPDERRSSPRGADRSRSRRDRRDRPERSGVNWAAWIGVPVCIAVLVGGGVWGVMWLTKEPPPAPKAPPAVAAAPGQQQPEGQGFFIAQGQQGVPVDPLGQQGGAPVGAAMPTDMDPATVQKVKRSTVYLRVTTSTGQIGEGTGFLAIEPGLVLTNAHVVGMMSQNAAAPRNIQVVLNSGEAGELVYPGTVLGAESSLDLAVVRIEAGGAPLPPLLPMIDSSLRLSELQKVYVFGFPFGAQLGKNITVTPSAVSSLRKNPFGGIQRIQVNGGMNPGNSGGPVVDARGVVVGIAVSIIQGTQINFAVPVDHVRPLLYGFARETIVGAPYRAADGTVKLPIRVHCTDPLKRIKEVQLDVWTGATGIMRPPSLFQPPLQAGDSEKKTVVLTYRDGGASADIECPEAALGGAVWLQPVLVNQTGLKQWSLATPYVPDDDAPLDRIPATFQLAGAKLAERTLSIEVTRQVHIMKGQLQLGLSGRTELTMLEHLQADPRGINVQLHPGGIRVKHEVGGKIAPSIGAPYVERLLFGFLMNPDGTLKERVAPAQPKTLTEPLIKADVDNVLDSVFNYYEACNVIVPERTVPVLDTWNAKLPVLMYTDGKNIVVDVNLTCTYEGTRKQSDRELAYVRLNGAVRGRIPQAEASGKAHGFALFDLSKGFIAQAKVVVDAEVFTGAAAAHNVLDIQLVRQAGNTQSIARVDPKAKLPTKLEQFKDLKQNVAKITKGKSILDVKDTITAGEPIDNRKPGGRYKEYKVKLTAGAAYVIEMNTPDGKKLDPYLRLETMQGAALSFDDDGGGDLNARIIYTADRTAEYKIIATVFDPNQVGEFSLAVSELTPSRVEAAPAKPAPPKAKDKK